jgi:predicted transposase YbfD/YdcC
VASIRDLIPGEIVAIDGKTLRRSHDRAKGLAALHLVSAWASANRVVLGQVATEAKSNEITAIPPCWSCSCSRAASSPLMRWAVRPRSPSRSSSRAADYVLALKGNQETLAAEVEEAFIDADARTTPTCPRLFETVERGHGRVETRRYRTLTDLSGVSRSPLWKAMNMIGMVESEREINGNSTETRYFIGSIGTDAATFARAVRAHWGIENKLHWSLDMAFREDDSRVREPAPARTSPCCATSP